jgi:hypothetical protein
MIGLAVVVLLVIALLLGGFVWYRRNQEFNKKKDAYPQEPELPGRK